MEIGGANDAALLTVLYIKKELIHVYVFSVLFVLEQA